MRPVVKGLLAGCVVLLVLAAIAVVVGIRWVNANGDRLRAQVDQARADGREFGRSATESACVAKAIEMYRANSSFLSEVPARMWLSNCLETSTPEDAFCAQVPPKDEIMRTVTWRLGECSRLGLDGDKGCTRVLQEVQTYCEKRPRR